MICGLQCYGTCVNFIYTGSVFEDLDIHRVDSEFSFYFINKSQKYRGGIQKMTLEISSKCAMSRFPVDKCLPNKIFFGFA